MFLYRRVFDRYWIYHYIFLSHLFNDVRSEKKNVVIQILRVAAKEADIDWQELDTSEASAPGGPFPQIDASEFTYEIVLFESVGRVVSSYRYLLCPKK